MKYDDSEYYFLNFETELDNHAANTHIGMYLAWAVLAGLGRGDGEDVGAPDVLAALKARTTTGADVLSDLCDGKLFDSEFNPEGNAFTQAYYEKGFDDDYARVFADQIPNTGHPADDACSVPNSWANFDKLKPVLDRRFQQWKAGVGPFAPSTDAKAPAPANLGPTGGRELSLEPLAGEAAPAPPPSATGGAKDINALRRRAEGGDRDAWYELAIEYITGQSVPQDFTQAANAFEKAAQAGIPEAAFNLGVCYQNGDGRPKDPKQRLRWFALAAEGGHGQAAYFLALAYRQGDTLPQDFVASNALMLLAQRRGVDEARAAGVMAGSLSESMALADRLSEPGRLVAELSSRRRKLAAGQVDSGVERWTNGPGGAPQARAAQGVSSQATGGSRRADPGDEAEQASSFGLGHVALLIGASNLVLPLLVGARGKGFAALTVTLGLIGAYGVFAVAPKLGAKGAMRWVLTALAAVPVLGSFANLALVVR